MTVLRALARRTEERAIGAVPWGEWDTGKSTHAGPRVTAQTSVQLLTVYGCVRLIVDSISTLPLDVFRRLSDGTRENLSVPTWLATPTVGMSRVAWLSQVISSLLLDGNAYIAVKRNEARQLVELVVLDSQLVSIRREKGMPVLYVNGQPPSYQVIHIPALILAGYDKGLSPIEAARQSIGLGLAAQEYGARFFGQGATLSGVIETPGELSADKASEMARAWARKHSGTGRAHLPGVLEGGATWKPTGVTNEQAQFLETRGYTAAEIAGQLFLVDPSDLGIGVSGTSLTYANLEQRNLRRVQVTLLPWIVRIEEALSALLAQPRYVKFNVDGLLRADLRTRYESYQIGISSKFMVPNQARAFEDWPPLPDGDDFPEEPKQDEPPKDGPDDA